MNLLKLSWKNIINKPLNLLLSMVLFGLGIGLINFLILLNHQMKSQFDKNLAGIDVVIGAKGSPLQMILCNMYHIDNPTGNISVKEAAPFLNPKHPLIETAIPLSLGDSHKGYRIVGTDYSILKLYGGEIGEGKLWTNHFDVTIGKVVAEELGMKIGDRFQSNHGFQDVEGLLHEHEDGFVVVGILEPTGSVIDQLILTTTKSIWDVHGHEEGGTEEHADHNHDHDHEHDATRFNLVDYPEQEITSLLIKFRNRTNFQALNLPRNINENTDMQAAAPPIEINRLYSMIGVGVDALRNIAIIIALVSAFSIFISLFSSLKDRQYELALMRVMGAGRNKLFLLILLEGIMLAIVGYLLGFLISHIGMEVLAHYAKSSYRYSFTGWLFLKEELGILGVSVLIGIIAAIIPAISAYRTDIHETLAR
jgi:putative ABC transport system permease protein